MAYKTYRREVGSVRPLRELRELIYFLSQSLKSIKVVKPLTIKPTHSNNINISYSIVIPKNQLNFSYDI